mgnify:CR=1 FL=1
MFLGTLIHYFAKKSLTFVTTMALILDDNSEKGAHARKEQSLLCDLFKAFD